MNKCQNCAVDCRGMMCRKCRNTVFKIEFACRRVTVICIICQKVIGNFPPSTAKLHKTCSHECHSMMRSQQFSRPWTESHKINHKASKTLDKIIKIGDFTCSKCSKEFSSNTSLRAHRSYCSHIDPGTTSCTSCQMSFTTERAWKIHNSLVHKMSEDLKSRRGHLISVNRNHAERLIKYTSLAENRFACALKERCGLEVVAPFRDSMINHTYDVYIPKFNLLIEFDGDYWHGNLKLFKMEQRFSEQWERDLKWSKLALAHGYTFMRVWDSESENWLKELENAGHQDIQGFIDSKKWNEETCLRHPGETESQLHC
jgi:tRNA isopentenyl-2-thiomethyl-A-37 hydroxylase MiaE